MLQRRHAASNCYQERALGFVCAVTGADLDQELTAASVDIILPVVFWSYLFFTTEGNRVQGCQADWCREEGLTSIGTVLGS